MFPISQTILLDFKGYDKVNKRLAISTCPNQDPLQATTGLCELKQHVILVSNISPQIAQKQYLCHMALGTNSLS